MHVQMHTLLSVGKFDNMQGSNESLATCKAVGWPACKAVDWKACKAVDWKACKAVEANPKFLVMILGMPVINVRNCVCCM